MKEERKEEERQTDRKNTRGTEQQRERTPQGNSATSTPPSNDRRGAFSHAFQCHSRLTAKLTSASPANSANRFS